ncbi:hypothetical protein SH2C18_42270 [Clostridium sediminicola]
MLHFDISISIGQLLSHFLQFIQVLIFLLIVSGLKKLINPYLAPS